MKDMIKPLLITILILLIPLFGNLYFAGFYWELFDFVLAGGLIFSLLLGLSFVRKQSVSGYYKIAWLLASLALFLLVWINGAVGIIGSEDNVANSLYLGVFLVFAVGSLITRFSSHGMSYVLFLTALVHSSIPVIAFLIWQPNLVTGMITVFIFNFLLALVWAGSGLMFRFAYLESVKN